MGGQVLSYRFTKCYFPLLKGYPGRHSYRELTNSLERQSPATCLSTSEGYLGLYVSTRFILNATLHLFRLVLYVGAVFFAYGGLDWWQGWLYLSLSVAGVGTLATYIFVHDRELFYRRAQYGEGTQRFEFFLLPLFGAGYFAIPVVAAADVGRYHWSPEMPFWLLPIGVLAFLVSLLGLGWVMSVNTHFETTVRIQHDRNHQVITTGPYRFVRHPGYAVIIVGFLVGGPLVLGSWWSFAPAFIAAVALMIRTAMEDRVLHRELRGYSNYAAKVKYRIFPNVW